MAGLRLCGSVTLKVSAIAIPLTVMPHSRDSRTRAAHDMCAWNDPAAWAQNLAPFTVGGFWRTWRRLAVSGEFPQQVLIQHALRLGAVDGVELV